MAHEFRVAVQMDVQNFFSSEFIHSGDVYTIEEVKNVH